MTYEKKEKERYSKLFDFLRDVWNSPLERLGLVLAVLLIIFAFNPVSHTDEGWIWQPSIRPNWSLFVCGVVLLVFSIFFGFIKPRKSMLSTVHRIQNGYRMDLTPRLKIDVVSGEIQKVNIDPQHGAVVLPANTSFDDECIKDNRSASGAFVGSHFPNGIEQFQKLIQKELSKITGKSIDNLEDCPIGTTILIDRPLGTNYKIIITAVTEYGKDHVIRANTLSLIASIREVFKLSSSNRLSELCMPVLGTGQGGLEFSTALSLLLFQCVHCVIHEGWHHVKNLKVVVYDPQNKRIEEVKKIMESISEILKR